MDLDADEIERIGATIQSLRARVSGDTPVRLYRTRGGEFVRVLDDDTAPLTPEMLRAIEAYTSNGGRKDGRIRDDETENGEQSVNDDHMLTTHSVITTLAGPSRAGPREEERQVEGNENAVRFDRDVVMEDSAGTREQVERPVEEETPDSLATAGIAVGAWLSGEGIGCDDGDTMEKPNPQSKSSRLNQTASFESVDTRVVTGDPIETVILHWPQEIRERTRLCYNATRAHPAPPHCVVYWLRNAFRVTHGNFSLAAAIALGKHYNLPVVVVYLSSPSILYPVRHASGINDAVTRWSVAELRRQLRDDFRIEFFGFTPRDSQVGSETSTWTNIDGGSALYALLDAFHPTAVITDDGFSLTTRTEPECLRQFLETRIRAPWSLLAVDSTTCVPFQSLSDTIRKSLSVDAAQFLSEDEFYREYASLLQCRDRFSIALAPSQATLTYQSSLRATIEDNLQAAMAKISVEEITWSIVEGMNAQSANSIATSSQRIGLERLESLVSGTDDRPAIQQELQGAGISSLMPYVRHGSLFSGYILDRLGMSIALMPRPTNVKSRKTFATLKVLRSRASSNLAKERDYCLYLSLWATRQHERELQLSGRAVPFRALPSFKTDLSELDTYKQVLPTWISPNKNLAGSSCQSPVFDPYQLESGRTDDQYWNEIQVFLIENRYVHPLVMPYWAYRIFQWSISTRAAIATIEALLGKCSLGSSHSPDVLFSVWISLFRVGKCALDATEADFIERVEAELSAQPRLQFQK